MPLRRHARRRVAEVDGEVLCAALQHSRLIVLVLVVAVPGAEAAQHAAPRSSHLRQLLEGGGTYKELLLLVPLGVLALRHLRPHQWLVRARELRGPPAAGRDAAALLARPEELVAHVDSHVRVGHFHANVGMAEALRPQDLQAELARVQSLLSFDALLDGVAVVLDRLRRQHPRGLHEEVPRDVGVRWDLLARVRPRIGVLLGIHQRQREVPRLRTDGAERRQEGLAQVVTGPSVLVPDLEQDGLAHVQAVHEFAVLCRPRGVRDPHLQIQGLRVGHFGIQNAVHGGEAPQCLAQQGAREHAVHELRFGDRHLQSAIPAADVHVHGHRARDLATGAHLQLRVAPQAVPCPDIADPQQLLRP
mmetsp:Transcript_20469/g.52179  ORF Transcript_20469/g.52179 Transcript_20469/m.52179 type:complete len:361 (-) Transcript_20469:1163-2245(-)